MKTFGLIIGLWIIVTFNVAAANNPGVATGQPAANTFAVTPEFPVYTQTCARNGAAFSCGDVTLLASYINLSQTSLSSTLLGNGCSDKGNGVFFCLSDSQFGQSMGGTVVLWARNYELIGLDPTTAPVYIIYIYVLN